jgi:hypothetical protein
MGVEIMEITLCNTCNSAHLCEDLTSLDYHFSEEVASKAAEVIGKIPFHAEPQSGKYYDHTCDACGQCDRYHDLMEGEPNTVYIY